MFTSVQGIYRNGKIELAEQPQNVSEDSPVIVTFLQSAAVDLVSHGVNPDQASELRASLSTFAEDWDAPEMDLYDSYDAIKSARAER